MEETRIFVITGPIGSGKSTLAREMQTIWGYRVYPELGGQIRQVAGCGTTASCSIFDEYLMFKELDRDTVIEEEKQRVKGIVLEQWHVGNLAYCKLRAPQYYDGYITRLNKVGIIEMWKPTFINLEIDVESLIKRTYHAEVRKYLQEDQSFIRKWIEALDSVYSDLNATPRIIDANLTPKEILKLL